MTMLSKLSKLATKPPVARYPELRGTYLKWSVYNPDETGSVVVPKNVATSIAEPNDFGNIIGYEGTGFSPEPVLQKLLKLPPDYRAFIVKEKLDEWADEMKRSLGLTKFKQEILAEIK